MQELTKLNDSELISLSKDGNDDATECLIIRYKALVCKIARSFFISTGGDTEDLIQEGTVGLLKAIREYNAEKGVPFISFASYCISNKVRDVIRGMNRDKHEPLNDAISISDLDRDGEQRISEQVVASMGNPLARYQDDESRRSFYIALNKIATPLQYSVLELYLEGKSYKEIGEELNITPKLVDNTLTAVKLRIKKRKSDFIPD